MVTVLEDVMGIMWCMHNRTTEEQARINRGRVNNGAVPKVEDTTALDDDYDVNIGLAGSGVVHDPTKPNNGTVGTCQCSDGSNDRCVCGVART